MQKFYEKEDITLFQGDCVEILNRATPESIDMIFADPPYMLSNGGISCHAGKVVSVNKGKWDESKGLDEDFEFHQKWINACKRVLKPNGTIWISGTYHSIYACGFALQKAGFKILNDICWFKPNASPNMSCRYFTASHETLLWARKVPKGKHTFNYEAMKNGDWGDDILKKPNKQMRSVWQIDPFTGSSTTGIMALELGRKFIGIDLEKEYLDLSVKRFEQVFSRKEKVWQ